MMEWFNEAGVYQIGLALWCLVALALLLWGLLGDRSRGRPRCPKCWYDLRGAVGGADPTTGGERPPSARRAAAAMPITCPECGCAVRTRRGLYRNRRRWRAIVISVILLVPPALALHIYNGWRREIRIQAENRQFYLQPDAIISKRIWLRLPRGPREYLLRTVEIYIPDGIEPPDPTDDQLAILGRLPYLRKVHIRSKKITDAGLAHLRDVPHLEELSISGSVTGAELRHVRHPRRMRRLGLGLNAIDDEGARVIGRMVNLEYLDLRSSRITDEGLAHLGKITELRILRLRWTGVTDAGLAHLGGLKYLQSIDLTGTRVTDAGIADLKRTLPDLRVRRD